jgi:hypothetical protein
VHLGVVDAKRLDFDDDVPRFGLGLRNVLVNQAVEAAEFLQYDRAHDDSPDLSGARKSRIAMAISPECVCSAKCPVSKTRTTALRHVPFERRAH